MRRFVLRAVLLLILVAALGGPTKSVSAVAPNAPGFDLRLPARLESQRVETHHRIDAALDHVIGWFQRAGFSVSKTDMIQHAVVFGDRASARATLARAFGEQPKQLDRFLPTFGGTVNGGTLFLVSQDLYEPIWRKLYAAWPWEASDYDRLIMHELTHRAHALVCLAQFGTEDAMGPTWFFEGLANFCAGMFPLGSHGQSAMTDREVLDAVRTPTPHAATYPFYARLVASLARHHPIKSLILHASEAGFPGDR